jgi:N-acetylmuramoyl-L-alanine amidase CwlA
VLPIVKKQIVQNRTRVFNRKIDFIVIHYTANYSAGAGAYTHFDYFNNAYRGSSADFFIDDKNILQINDYKLYRSWAVGNGKGEQGITNDNSISIEICVNQDSDLSIAIKNTMELTAYLMKELNLGIDKVKRHYDCGGDWKLCPLFYCGSPEKDNEWNNFKNKVVQELMKDYKQILSESGLSNPEKWIQIITDLESGKINLEDINYLKFFKALIEKIGNK